MSLQNSNDLYADPLGTAAKAAAQIAERTGILKHDIALVMGSGWVGASDALGTPTHEFDARESTRLVHRIGSFQNDLRRSGR